MKTNILSKRFSGTMPYEENKSGLNAWLSDFDKSNAQGKPKQATKGRKR